MAAVSAVMGAAMLTACASNDVSGPVQSKQIDECKTLSVEPMSFSVTVAGSGGSKGGGSRGGGGKVSVTKPGKVNTNKPGGSSGSTGSKDSKPSKGKKKSCSTEYELMVNDKEDGLVEQDVASEEYARCEVGEMYPACKED